MLRILMGKAKSGKTHMVYSEIEKAIQAGRSDKVILLVPEQFTLEAEKGLLNHMQKSGFLGVEVLSFKRLIYKLLNEVEMPPYQEITTLGRTMLLKSVFQKNSQALTYYRAASQKRGFLNQFDDFLDEMKHSLVDASLIQTAISKLDETALLSLKLKDLAFLLGAYEEAKTETYMDSVDVITFALDRMSNSKRLKHAQIWVDGFDSFSKIEYQIIEQLMLLCEHLTITVPYGESNIFAHTGHLYRQLVALANQNQIKTAQFLMAGMYLNPEIGHLSENLLVYPYERFVKPTEFIKLHIANTVTSEVEHVVIDIVNLVRYKGLAWKEIAVVTNDLSGYEFVIKELFTEYQVPFFLDRKMNILSHPLVHLIVNSLKTIQSHFKREYVMSMLKTGLLGFSMDEIGILENYIIEFGIQGNQYKKDFKKNYKNNRLYDLEHMNALREKLLEKLAPLLSISSSKKVEMKALLTMIYEFLVLNDIAAIMDREVQHFTEIGAYDSAQLFAQIWNVVIETFDQTAELLGNEMLNLDEVIELLETGFEHAEIGLLPLYENQVLIGSLDRSRAHPIKALFIMGINDGILPEMGGDQQLIAEYEKEQLKEKGFNLLLDGKMFADKETYNIYNALTRPSESIYLSYALTSNDGTSLRPSYLMQKLIKIFPMLKPTHDTVSLERAQKPHTIATAQGTFKHLAVEMRKSVDGHRIHSDWETAFKWYVQHEPDKASLLLEGLTFENHVEKINRKVIDRLYEMPIKTSVSRLEQFMWCPFKHFVAYGIKPITVKHYEITFPDVGILFHGALEQFGRTVYDQNLVWQDLDQKTCDQMIEKIVEDMVDHDIFSSKFQYQYLIQKLKRVSKRAIWTLTKQLKQGDFMPIAFEMAFSDEGYGAPPMIIELSNGEKLMIRGVIDRVDLLRTEQSSYVKIIDYKSGGTTLSLSDIYHGLQMQLMVYLKACLDNPDYFRVEALKPGGIFYFKIDDPMIQSAEALSERIEAQIESQLRLDGIALEEPLILEKMDRMLVEESKSVVMKVSYKKDGAFTKDSKVLPLDTFYHMIDHVKEKIREIGMTLLEGEISPSPCQTEGRIACNACDYQSLCQFDPKFEGNAYRVLPKLDQESVIQKIKEKSNA
ncbi:helicase-exonuclease AddAB subunit AddB [Fusibacter ferrireducens]|uniref:Helicase-exonuclease AddAB subunit AddB n=1 Tax=Fusibacter ferrireducens TaxID=2785058 RepID=A0ABR9ZXY9_9FIRM|nr:helicase-exonuclease AddAB subunit AddB [Fusibacter ferrireducens]MBF4695330.1 helicase-exonuclease AddAB subunit AddB [Fusibacter ferrireducens]